MRIIVTQNGEDIVKLLNEEHENLLKERTSKEKKRKLSPIRKREKNRSSLPLGLGEMGQTHSNFDSHKNSLCNKGSRNQATNRNNKHKSDLINKLEMDLTTISIQDLNIATQVQIKQRKLNIPKNITEKYNNGDYQLPGLDIKRKSTMKPDQSFLPASSLMNTNTLRTKHSMKDILNETTYKKLKSTAVKDKAMKDKLSRITENQFRTVYDDKTYIEKIEEKLQKKINPDRINFIRYLKDKTAISETLVKTIADYDEEKINRVNKICQIVFHNEERGQLFKEIIKEKLQTQRERERVEYKTSIENMGRHITGLRTVLKSYEKKVSDKERYRDIHNDTVKKYWSRYKPEKFNKDQTQERRKSTHFNNDNASKMIYTESTDI
jgi:hypothetical protein